MNESDKKKLIKLIDETIQAIEKRYPHVTVGAVKIDDNNLNLQSQGNSPRSIAEEAVKEVQALSLVTFASHGGHIPRGEELLTEPDIILHTKAIAIGRELAKDWFNIYEHSFKHYVRMIRRSYRRDRRNGRQMYEDAIIGHIIMKFKADVLDSYEIPTNKKQEHSHDD